jgi:hypothetical protein
VELEGERLDGPRGFAKGGGGKKDRFEAVPALSEVCLLGLWLLLLLLLLLASSP